MQDAADIPIPPCPRCTATHVVRNGPNASGTPTFRCRECGRRFASAPKEGPVAPDRKELVGRMLGERMSLRGIAQVTGSSRSWVQGFVDRTFREDTPPHPGPLKKVRPAGDRGRRVVEFRGP